jgi:hypothetical protein
MRWTLLLLISLPGCRPVSLPQQPPAKPAMVPLSAYGTDWLCAETTINYPNDCVTVAEFRKFAASLRADP